MTHGRRPRLTLLLICVLLVTPSALFVEYQSQPHPPDCATASENHPACQDAGDARKHLAGLVILGMAGTGIPATLLFGARRSKL